MNESEKARASIHGAKASKHPHPFGNPTRPFSALLSVVEPEYVILHEEASLLVGHQLKHLSNTDQINIKPPSTNAKVRVTEKRWVSYYLAEPKLVLLAGELEVAADEHEDAAGEGRRGLAVDGADGVPALLEGQLGQLQADLPGAGHAVALEGQDGGAAVERGERAAVGIERLVVVLHEGPAHHVALAPRSPVGAAPLLPLPVHALRVM